jgi:hypothetical protein
MVLFRKHERTGRPIGDAAFIERLERLLDRELKPDMVEPLSTEKTVHTKKNGSMTFIKRLDRGGVCNNDG